MDSEKWPQMWDLFHSALELPPDFREAFLVDRCGADSALCNRIRSLLNSHHDADRFLEKSIVADQRQAGPRIPQRIGAFQIRRVIGTGGMGIVYEAEQQNPRRAVALKVIRGGAIADELRVQLFHREVQSLARLTHPGIAAIYEAGCTDDGLHYFVMEYVEGRPLNEFTRDLPDRNDRLDLFCSICDAVSHAHQKGVIHRDLKPGNILVSGGDAPDGAAARHPVLPKILDFGLARLVEDDAGGVTIMSGPDKISGTLAYMSPEQTRGGANEIDIRSDVYGLGVILYELLTDRSPYDLQNVALPEAVRRICEVPPLRPRSIAPHLHADLEAIVLKSLDKDPSRRYATANALAEDIRRFQAGQPVQARPATAAYQLRKLIQRHKAPAALLAIIVALIVTLLVSMVVQNSRIASERDRAIKAARIANEVNTFLNEDLLRSADPRVTRGRELTVRQAVDNAAKRIDGRFADDPQVEAAIRMTIGETYRRLGQFDSAEKHTLRALELRRGTLGPDQADTLDAMRELAVIYDDWGAFAKAQSLFEELLTLRKRSMGDSHPGTIQAMDDLSISYARGGQPEKAEPLSLAAMQARRKQLGPTHRETLLSMNNLAYVYLKQDRFAEAEPLAAEALASARRMFGDDEPALTLATANTLAMIYEKEKRFEESESLHRQTLAARRKVLGNTHTDTLTSMSNLARLYVALGRFDQAEPLLLERVAALRQDDTATPQQKRAALSALVALYQAWNRPDAAAQWQAKIVDP